jgi:hypothetical protein
MGDALAVQHDAAEKTCRKLARELLPADASGREESAGDDGAAGAAELVHGLEFEPDFS